MACKYRPHELWTFALILLAAACLVCCTQTLQQLGLVPPNTKVTVRIVNDAPNGTATVTFSFNGLRTPASVPIGSDGKGSVTLDTGTSLPGTVQVVCANGSTVQPATGIEASPASNSTVTADCGTLTFVHDPPSCRSMQYAMKRIDRLEPPVDDGMCNNYPSDFSNQSNRTRFASDFSAQADMHQAEANQLYSWLLGTTPPDNTVLNSLNAGQDLETQVIYIAAGSAFFSAAGGTNSNFVKRAYHLLLARDPTSSELIKAVALLNPHWIIDCDICGGQDPMCRKCQYAMPRDQWLGQTLVPSYEFYQVAGTVLLYGAHLSRAPSSTEINNLATQMNSMASFLQGGAIPIASSNEFYQDSANQWYAH